LPTGKIVLQFSIEDYMTFKIMQDASPKVSL